MAEWLCGACHRIYSARPAGSCDCVGRGAFTSAASRLCRLLQHLSDPSRIRQRHTAGAARPTSRPDHTDAQTRRTPPCLHPDMILGRDKPIPAMLRAASSGSWRLVRTWASAMSALTISTCCNPSSCLRCQSRALRSIGESSRAGWRGRPLPARGPADSHTLPRSGRFRPATVRRPCAISTDRRRGPPKERQVWPGPCRMLLWPLRMRTRVLRDGTSHYGC